MGSPPLGARHPRTDSWRYASNSGACPSWQGRRRAPGLLPSMFPMGLASASHIPVLLCCAPGAGQLLSAGVIPVVVADNWKKPFDDIILWGSCLLSFPTSQLHRVLPTLRQLPAVRSWPWQLNRGWCCAAGLEWKVLLLLLAGLCCGAGVEGAARRPLLWGWSGRCCSPAFVVSLCRCGAHRILPSHACIGLCRLWCTDVKHPAQRYSFST